MVCKTYYLPGLPHECSNVRRPLQFPAAGTWISGRPVSPPYAQITFILPFPFQMRPLGSPLPAAALSLNWMPARRVMLLQIRAFSIQRPPGDSRFRASRYAVSAGSPPVSGTQQTGGSHHSSLDSLLFVCIVNRQ